MEQTLRQRPRSGLCLTGWPHRQHWVIVIGQRGFLVVPSAARIYCFSQRRVSAPKPESVLRDRFRIPALLLLLLAFTGAAGLFRIPSRAVAAEPGLDRMIGQMLMFGFEGVSQEAA
ncbi:MAG: hypothetical protein AB7U38_14940, partial [Hyphomicrobiales bacterium]